MLFVYDKRIAAKIKPIDKSSCIYNINDRLLMYSSQANTV